MKTHEHFFIGGDWAPPAGPDVIEVVSPHTEEVIGRVPAGTPADVDRAVAAARAAFDHGPWPRTAPREPVPAVIPYDGEDDAVRIADDSDYGLAGSVWTADPERGMAIARRVRAGTYGVNLYAVEINAPFGGFKSSGIGRELGPEGLSSHVEYKSIVKA
jgi:acyl-CoA reductase-like NAD-dependent aldehyde dehydrogenase